MLLPLKYSLRLITKKRLEKDGYFRGKKAVVAEKAEVVLPSKVNNKKRNFLKAAGAAGALALVASLIPKKADAYVFGSTPASNVVGLKDTSNLPITPVKTGQLPEALTTTTGYLKVSILGGAADGVAGANVGIKNAAEQRINPATNEGLATLAQDESILLLRRIVKQLESGATVDRSNRQRVVIDGVGTGSTGVTTELAATVPVSMPASGAMGYQAGINNGQPVSGATPYTINSAASSWYVQVAEGPVDQRWRVAEDSHISYQIGVRGHLAWS